MKEIKMSYTKKTLRIAWFGIENHYALIGIIFLISCFLMPAFTIITIMNNGYSYMSKDDAQVIIRVYGTILAYLEGFALPLELFSYVHKRRDCDFYNSMPVRRSQYFLGYTLTGIAVFMVSFCWMFAAHFVISGFENIFPCFLQPIAMFLVIYCSMIFAVCFSGSVMSALVTFALRSCLFISIILLPLIISGVDAYSYYEFFGKRITALTPIFTVGAWIEEWYDVMLIQLPVAALELAAGFFLHKYRKSETTMAVAFPKSRYPFQYTVMLITALLFDALFSSMMFYYSIDPEGFDYSSTDFRLFIFFTVIVVLASFIFLNIILERTGRAAFSKIRHFFIFSVCYGLVLFTIFSYFAPNIPYEILPFKPEYAVICVNDITITKEYPDYMDDYYYDDDWEYGVENPAELVKKYGDYYSVYASGVIREAYCVTDKEKLSQLVDLVQMKSNRDESFLSSDRFYTFPTVNSEEELYSVKMYTVFFMKGNKPYIQEGMSIYNFSIFVEQCRQEERYCFTKGSSVMDQFLETKLDPMGFATDGGRSFTVHISAESSENFYQGIIPGDTTNIPQGDTTYIPQTEPDVSESTVQENLPAITWDTTTELVLPESAVQTTLPLAGVYG